MQKLILTAEDTDTEPIEQICSEMANNVTNEDLDVQTILERAEAVKHAVDEARAADGGLNILLLIGKGDEQWIKDRNIHTPYEGDSQIIRRLFA